MPAEVVNGAPRRARYLVPRSLPRRGEILAAAATLAILAHLLFAQLTLLLAVAFYLTGRATRWRASWLAVPAAAGVAWTLAAGPAAAAAGFASGPQAVMRYLMAGSQLPVHLRHPAGVFAGIGGWLPRQLPLAILAAVAEAAVATWLSWLHAGEPSHPERRAGLIVAARRALALREIRSGAASGPGGVCVGLVPGTGARVTVTWPELAGGALASGSDWAQTLATCAGIVSAAVRLRKPLLAIDLTGDPAVARQLAADCQAADTSLRVFGRACYEPFRHGDPAYRAALITGMLSWDGAASQHRPAAAAYLRDVLEVIDAAPGDPRVPVLDEIVHLLDPAALRARMARVPPGHARRPVLGERASLSVTLATAEPATVAELAAQLAALRSGPAGRWLRPPAEIDLGRLTRERGAALFCLGGLPQASALMIGRLVCHDLLALAGRLRAIGVGGDGLVWLAGSERLPGDLLARLFTAGQAAGLPVLAAVRQQPAAPELTRMPNVLLQHTARDPDLARELTAQAGSAAPPRPGEFTVAIAHPRRVVPRVAGAGAAR